MLGLFPAVLAIVIWRWGDSAMRDATGAVWPVWASAIQVGLIGLLTWGSWFRFTRELEPGTRGAGLAISSWVVGVIAGLFILFASPLVERFVVVPQPDWTACWVRGIWHALGTVAVAASFVFDYPSRRVSE